MLTSIQFSQPFGKSEFEEKHYGQASQVVPEFVDRLLKGL